MTKVRVLLDDVGGSQGQSYRFVSTKVDLMKGMSYGFVATKPFLVATKRDGSEQSSSKF